MGRFILSYHIYFNHINFIHYFNRYFIYIFYLFIYILFLVFLHIISFNEELVIGISIFFFFTMLASLLRKFILIHFYLESDLLYSLLYTVIGLYITYIKTTSINFLSYFFAKLKSKNINIYFITSYLIYFFKWLLFHFILNIREFKNKFKSKNDKYNKDLNTINFNILYSLDLLYMPFEFINFAALSYMSLCFFSKMSLYTTKINNISSNYVS